MLQGKIASFKNLFGQITGETDQPLAKLNLDAKLKHLTKKERVPDGTVCCSCQELRCIFAATKPTETQMEELSEITDTLLWPWRTINSGTGIN